MSPPVAAVGTGPAVPVQRLLQQVVLLLLLLGGCSGPDQPVSDPGRLLTPGQRARILAQQQALLRDLDIDFFLVISDTALPAIDRDAARLFAEYQVGRNSRSNRGVLFLVDPQRRELRMEISYTLEGVFPDAFIGTIQRRQMLPFFTSGHIGQGIEAAMELLVARAEKAARGMDYDPDAETGAAFLSGGAGASTTYRDAVPRPHAPDGHPQVPAQPSPRAALDVYLQVLADHNKRPDLALYSPDTREFFKNHTVTDAQFDHVLAALRENPPQKIIIRDDRAVIRYPVARRQLSPFFLIHGTRGWMFDFSTMNRTIRMNHRNQWHFVTLDHPYMFGFADLRFDANGFPWPAREP